MQVKEALKRYIQQKVKQKEVIHLIKIRQQLGKCTLTIGSGQGSGMSSKYAVYLYTKHCKCGELVYHEDDPYRVAEYLICFCGYDHLKENLPLRQYQ